MSTTLIVANSFGSGSEELRVLRPHQLFDENEVGLSIERISRDWNK